MEHILDTSICCYDYEAAEEFERLGITKPAPESWYDIAIDLRQCVAVRHAAEYDGKPQVTLYINSDAFTVAGEYDAIRARWLKARDADYFKAI